MESKENSNLKIKKDHRLKINYDKANNVINIIGNKSGLEYLASLCQYLASKNEQEHWHLSYAFNTLTEDSKVEVIISFEP